jgi:hypothetical protein
MDVMLQVTYTFLMGFVTQPRLARRRRLLLACGAVLISAAPAWAQQPTVAVFAQAGGASIGHSDSTQGHAPIFGGAASIRITPRFLLDGDVHVGRVTRVFGREDHEFTETMYTASLLWRAPVRGKIHALVGGGLGIQRAHTEFVDPSIGRFSYAETLKLLHGRAGIEFDASRRLVVRTEGVLWFGPGLDWVAGARAGLGYRF